MHTPNPHVVRLVSWYFEPSQLQRITSRLKTMFSLPPIYSAHKSSNNQLSKNHKISPDTNPHKAKNTQKHQAQFFSKKTVPSVLSQLKNYIRLEHAGIVDHSVDLAIPDFIKVYIKEQEWTEAIKKSF